MLHFGYGLGLSQSADKEDTTVKIELTLPEIEKLMEILAFEEESILDDLKDGNTDDDNDLEAVQNLMGKLSQ